MTFRPRPPVAAALLATVTALLPLTVAAQATVKPDGQFRYALGAGASYSSGNTSAASVNVNAEGVRATEDSKFRLGGKALWSRTEGTTTADNVQVGTQYDRDFDPTYFGFGSADYLRDTFSNISSRVAGHAGVGRHMVKRDDLTFDVSAGVGYTQDHYVDAADINGQLRTNYGRAELVLAEESQHKFTATTSFRQKLSFYPAISSGGGYRGVFDTGVAVSMTPTLSLTVGVTYRYDSDPGVGLKHNDTVVVTGLSLKID